MPWPPLSDQVSSAYASHFSHICTRSAILRSLSNPSSNGPRSSQVELMTLIGPLKRMKAPFAGVTAVNAMRALR